jgi:hypothetical protein
MGYMKFSHQFRPDHALMTTSCRWCAPESSGKPQTGLRESFAIEYHEQEDGELLNNAEITAMYQGKNRNGPIHFSATRFLKAMG